jgi:hypothetical protein
MKLGTQLKKMALVIAALVAVSCEQPASGGDGPEEKNVPALTGSVSIAGSPMERIALLVDDTELDGTGALSCQWYRGETPIAGATGVEYTPVTADVNRVIKVRVKRAGYTGSVTSRPTATVAAWVEPMAPDVMANLAQPFSVSNEGTRYFSLSTGEQVAEPSGTNWDIYFQETRTVGTNSGETATQMSSGGQGGIWPTNKTDFASVTLADKKEGVLDGFDYTPWHTDKIRWVANMYGYQQKPVNVATYVGFTVEFGSVYAERDGRESGRNALFPSLNYDKKAYYTMFTMGVFVPSLQVYIVRGADGVHHFKVQIQKFDRYTSAHREDYEVLVEALN